jgi:hypothetical protein
MCVRFVRMMDRSARRGCRVPVLTGAGCAAGFGVLAGLWFSRAIWAGEPVEPLPGLFDYPSAYVGDSLLLPVTVALLVAGIRELPMAPGDRMVAAVAALGGAGALASLQLLWLLDDDPERNWTLSAPHRFNIAGIWHAVYAVLVAALVTGAFAMLARRLSSALAAGGESRERARGLLNGAGATGVLSCFFSYAVLVVRDSTAGTFGSRSTLAGLAIGFVVLLALTMLVLRRSMADLWPSALLGVLAGAAVAIVFVASWHADTSRILGAAQAVLTAMGVVLVALVPRLPEGRAGSEDPAVAYREYRPTIGNVVLAGVILALLLPALWTLAAAQMASSHWPAATGWSLGYTMAILVATVAVVRKDRLSWLRQAADVLLVFAAFGAIALAAMTVPNWSQASDLAPVGSLVVAGIISRMFFPMFQIRMNSEIRDEQSPAVDGRFGLRGAARLSAIATFGMLAVAALTGAISLLTFTLAAAIDRKYITDSGALPGVRLLLAVGVGLVVVVATLAWIKKRAQARRLAVIAPLAVLVWPATLALFGAHGVPPVTWMAILAGVLLALWSANTLLNNAGLLPESPIDRLHLATIGAMAVSGFASGSFALSVALASGPSHVYTWFAGISTGGAVLVVHGGLGAAAGSLVSRSPQEQTRHGLVYNLIQDAVLMVLLYLITLVIPLVTLLHLPPTLSYWERLAATFAIVGPFLAYFLGPYQWNLTLNLGHLDREITSRVNDSEPIRTVINAETGLRPRNRVLVQAMRGELSGSEQERFLRILNAHIRNQNLLANAVVALSILGLLVLTTGKTTALLAYLRREAHLDPAPETPPPG